MNPLDILSEIRTICQNSIHTKTNSDLQYIELLTNKILAPQSEYPPADYTALPQLQKEKRYNPIEHYQSLYGFNLKDAARQYLISFVQQHPPQLVELALNKAHAALADKPINYANKLLIAWKQQCYTTIEQVEKEGVKPNGKNQRQPISTKEDAKERLRQQAERLKDRI